MKCNICGNQEMVEIWYGFPTWKEIDLARQDKLVLGGPIKKEYTHYCFQCQETHPQINVPYFSYDD